jgi:hypothetical protein
MTIPSQQSDPSHDRRMDDVKQEIARAMAQELKLRAAERVDRIRRLGLNAMVDVVSDSLRRLP